MSTKNNNEISPNSIPGRSLADFNISETRGWVIERLIQIEYRIDNIIFEFFQPKHANVFKDIVLNSSVLNFGGKSKIIRNMGLPKSLIEKIRRLVAIRNGFAHADLSENLIIKVAEDGGGNEDVDIEATSTINIMNSEGIIKVSEYYKFRSDFLNLYLEVKKELDDFLNSMRLSNESAV